MKISPLLGLGLVLALLAALAGATRGVYLWGHSAGQAACTSKVDKATIAQQGSQAQATARKANADIARAARTGQQREAQRAAIDKLFTTLQTQATDDAPHPVDACTLPADRLRRWADANAGPAATADRGTAAGQPVDPAVTAASATLWPAARAGSQPPAGGPPVPPAGQPDLPAAGLVASPLP